MNVRLTRSAGRSATTAGLVVRTRFVRVAPSSPTTRMSRRTWSRPASIPRRPRVRQAFRTPYTPKCARWTRVMIAFSVSSLIERAEGGRLLAA